MRLWTRGASCAGILALALSLPFGAAAADFPSTKDEFYEMGQRFGRCAGYFGLVSAFAGRQGLTDTKARAENLARGWRIVALFFTAEGLPVERGSEAASIVDAVIDIKTTDLRSALELRGPEKALPDAKAEFDRECGPYTSIQEAMVESIRRGPVPTTK